jgi:hypothetical protein
MSAAPAPGAAPAPPKKGLMTRFSGMVANHPSAAFGVIVVLAVLVVATLVYYRGLAFLGPFAGRSGFAAAVGGAAGAAARPAAADAAKADPETERLIESINKS